MKTQFKYIHMNKKVQNKSLTIKDHFQFDLKHVLNYFLKGGVLFIIFFL